MASRDYVKLPIEQFGRQLLISGDLDPIYIALVQCQETGTRRDQIKRWLIAYWCFYHAGVASYLSDFHTGAFWEWMDVAAQNTVVSPIGERWPRGKERRHFRGDQGIDAVRELSRRYPKPEDMVDYIFERGDTKYETVANRVKEHRGFGDWISFKVCDMGERILGAKIDFTQAAIFMFTDPVKAALRVWEERTRHMPSGKNATQDQGQIINNVVLYLTAHFKAHTAPPRHERPVGLQEVETILCKWKSHMNGHYPLNNDLHEIRDGLASWANHSKMARKFLNHMPEIK